VASEDDHAQSGPRQVGPPGVSDMFDVPAALGGLGGPVSHFMIAAVAFAETGRFTQRCFRHAEAGAPGYRRSAARASVTLAGFFLPLAPASAGVLLASGVMHLPLALRDHPPGGRCALRRVIRACSAAVRLDTQLMRGGRGLG
jgi:hypothetical protein